MQEHQKEAEFIEQTVSFLVEHSRKEHREEIAARAKDFVQRYQALSSSVDTYVSSMQDSIPIWKEFNDHGRGMLEWLDHVQGELESDHTQPGNAIVTERSLGNTEVGRTG